MDDARKQKKKNFQFTLTRADGQLYIYNWALI